jgi:hypothetical protein
LGEALEAEKAGQASQEVEEAASPASLKSSISERLADVEKRRLGSRSEGAAILSFP